MDIKFRFFLALAAFAVLGFGMAGCELEEDADADMTTSTTTTTSTATSTETSTTTTTTDPGDPYSYVRIDDLSPFADTPDGGADIDAVVLDKVAGGQFYAESVEAFLFGGGTAELLDATEATGAPDAFEFYPDTTECRVDAGFVSLGGTGGALVLKMQADIEAGDTVSVLEVGGCDFGNGTAIIEEVEVSVGIGKEIDGSWVSLGTGEGPEVSFTVPTLP